MKSPFPGMDPFIEASGRWEGFHTRLIAEMDRELSKRLPQGYVSDIGERCYIDYIDPKYGLSDRAILPDVKVRSSPQFGGAPSQTGAAVAEPPPGTVIMHGLVEAEMKEIFLEIRELDPDSRLVTCIEVLSPTNKRPHTPGWYLYQRKRQVFLQGHANLVEIDLLRGGQRMPMIEGWPELPYHISVLRRQTAPRFEICSAHFNAPLPEISIPLAPPDPDIKLPLQPIVDEIYARAKFDLSFNYHKPIDPPLTAAEAAWLVQQLAQRRG